MKIDLMLIGGELIHGKRSDLNGPELARQLRPLGHEIQSIITLADHPQELIEQLRNHYSHALSSPEQQFLLITSGGLGPTLDDLTKTSLAQAFKLTIEDSPLAREILRANYARHQRLWEPALNSYQLIPQSVVPLNNPTGHAPGLLLKKENLSILCLPGVPHEFASILKEQLSSGLIPAQQSKKWFTVKSKEVAEEVIFNKLCPGLWAELEAFGPVSSLPHAGGVEISIETTENNFPLLENLFRQSALAPHIWQYGDLPINHYLIQQLLNKKLTLSVAESCSGGLCSHLLTEIAGSSGAFLGGVISYSNHAKIELLNVSSQIIDEYTEVSGQTAIEMALGVKKKLGTDLGLSFTGFAGPTGGTENDPVGTVYIGLATPDSCYTFRYQFYGERSFVKQKFVQYGFYRVLDWLQSH